MNIESSYIFCWKSGVPSDFVEFDSVQALMLCKHAWLYEYFYYMYAVVYCM